MSSEKLQIVIYFSNILLCVAITFQKDTANVTPAKGVRKVPSDAVEK